MLAFYVHDLSPFVVRLTASLGVRWYGFAYLLGFVLGWMLLRAMARRGYAPGISPEKVSDFVAGACLWGVLLGGRVGYVLFYDLEAFLRDPLLLVRFWNGGISGMSSHGGVLGLLLYTLWYAWKHRIHWLDLGDNLVVAAPIGIFFGRCANFINGELFGRPTTVPWAVQFPKELFDNPSEQMESALQACEQLHPQLNTPGAVVDAAQHDPQVREILAQWLTPRHPSQIYEALLEGLFLFLALLFLRTKTRVPRGVVTSAFFLLYAFVRIFGEQYRQPDPGIAFILGLTRGQFLSLFMIAVGAWLLVTSLRANQPSPRPQK